MKPNDLALGMALMCNHDGLIFEILHNDFALSEAEILGKAFPMFVATSSFTKALSFLVELRVKGTVFDWEFDLLINNQIILIHCAAITIEGNFLIMVAQTRFAVNHLFEEMIGINNDQTNLLRNTTKQQVELLRAHPEPDNKLYDELSKMNNELVTLQRELVKKNIELERLNAEVKRLSIVDDLTQLYNRRGFFELGRREVTRSQEFGEPLTAIMFDLDHFKQVNDTYGHAIGDKVLQEVAARCSQQLRKIDIFGRYGGEEFSILLPETEIPPACATAERLRYQVSHEPIITEHGLLTVTISLGVAILTDNIIGLEELLDEADQALYKAKESGRNRVWGAGGE